MTASDVPQAYDYPLLIKQLWHGPLATAGEQQIVYRDLRRMTYQELYFRVGRLANALKALGVRAGDTVAIMDWDSHRYLECLYAIPMMGATLMTVNIRLAPEQIRYTLDHSGADILLLNSEFVEIFEQVAKELTDIRTVLWISDRGDAPPASLSIAGEYEELLDVAQPEFNFLDFDEHTRATTFYTTGTTGLPKGVYFSHRQLVLQTLSVMAALASPSSGQRFHRGDVYMPLTPMFHVHAWGLPYVALQLGVKQVYPGRYVPEDILSLIISEEVTFSHCVPTILQMLLTDPSAEHTDLSNWKVVIGGSALSKSLASEAVARGIDIFGGYGMSETGPVLALAQIPEDLPPEEEIKFRCKAGSPIPLVHLRTVDADMNDVEGDGEVVARSPWLTQGYVNRPEASEELWRNGWLHTQDIGFRERGFVKISDRTKDVIKSGGEWISSLQLEDLISRHDSIAEVAVIAVPDKKWGERPLALVVGRKEAVIDTAEIMQHIAAFAESGEISRYAVPAKIVQISELARTSVGKLDKKMLRDKYVREIK
jgi:fatty-acyl-CoA synthase